MKIRIYRRPISTPPSAVRKQARWEHVKNNHLPSDCTKTMRRRVQQWIICSLNEKESVFAWWGHRLLSYLILLFEADNISSQSGYLIPGVVFRFVHVLQLCCTTNTEPRIWSNFIGFLFGLFCLCVKVKGLKRETGSVPAVYQFLVPYTHKTNPELWGLKFRSSLGSTKQMICQRGS